MRMNRNTGSMPLAQAGSREDKIQTLKSSHVTLLQNRAFV